MNVLDEIQRRAFAYFEHETNPHNGLVIDTTTRGAPSSIAAVGLALTTYPAAVERGFISRKEAAARALVTLRFFWRSNVWIDFRGIQDTPMRTRASDYFENSRRATEVRQQYAIRNPRGYAAYGETCWGITASNGPGDVTRDVAGVTRQFFGYLARGVPDGPDDGTIAPWGGRRVAPVRTGDCVTHD